jgi:TRAP-type C4-dicarboxylate transport system substrate-binding protein
MRADPDVHDALTGQILPGKLKLKLKPALKEILCTEINNMIRERSMLRKYLRRASGMALAGLLALGAGVPVAQATERLVYATYISEVYSASRTDIWLMREIERRSNGEITFEQYWNSSLLKAPDLFPGLSSGAADIVLGNPAGYNVREYPLANIVMPFMSKRADAVTYAWRDLYANNAAFRREFESRGAKVLYAIAWAENSIWSRRPVTSLNDFRGLRVRAVPTISDGFQRLGATPVALAWADGLEGLRRGVVDAMSSAPFDSAVHGGAQEVARYGTDAGSVGIFSMATVAMSLDRYNRLSERHRKIIDEVAQEAPRRGLQDLDESVNAAVAKLCERKGNLTVNFFSSAEADRMQSQAGSEMQANWLRRATTEARADGNAMLEEYMRYIRKYEADSTYVPGFERFQNRCGGN